MTSGRSSGGSVDGGGPGNKKKDEKGWVRNNPHSIRKNGKKKGNLKRWYRKQKTEEEKRDPSVEYRGKIGSQGNIGGAGSLLGMAGPTRKTRKRDI